MLNKKTLIEQKTELSAMLIRNFGAASPYKGLVYAADTSQNNHQLPVLLSRNPTVGEEIELPETVGEIHIRYKVQPTNGAASAPAMASA